MRPLFLCALLACTAMACDKKPAYTNSVGAEAPSVVAPAVSLDPAAVVRGDVPVGGAEVEVLNTRCVICHTMEYITQQRLTDAQWAKTLTKMQKWGSPITDDEKNRLGPWLARVWSADLADRDSPRVAPPSGAVPDADASTR